MDIEKEVRALMHKLNHGVGKASSMDTWKSKLTETPDGDAIGVERVDEATHNLGHVGPASPCCDAPGEEHAPDCSYANTREGNGDDFDRWLRDA